MLEKLQELILEMVMGSRGRWLQEYLKLLEEHPCSSVIYDIWNQSEGRSAVKTPALDWDVSSVLRHAILRSSALDKVASHDLVNESHQLADHRSRADRAQESDREEFESLLSNDVYRVLLPLFATLILCYQSYWYGPSTSNMLCRGCTSWLTRGESEGGSSYSGN